MAQHPNTLIEWIKQDPIRTTVHINCLDHFQGIRVPHGDRLGGGESVMRLGINRGAAGLNAVDIAYRFKRIQVENSQMPFRPTARSVQASSFDVREDVVKSAFAA